MTSHRPGTSARSAARVIAGSNVDHSADPPPKASANKRPAWVAVATLVGAIRSGASAVVTISWVRRSPSRPDVSILQAVPAHEWPKSRPARNSGAPSSSTRRKMDSHGVGFAVHERHGGAHDSGLFVADLLQRIAQVVGVLNANAGDDTEVCIDDIDCVQAAAEAHLEHRDVHRRSFEQVQGRQQGKFEIGQANRFAGGIQGAKGFDDIGIPGTPRR